MLTVGALVAAASASAAPINVNTNSDAVAADLQCSLREAMQNANDNAGTNADCTAGSGADIITFTLPNPSTITLDGTELPQITDALAINGPGVSALTITGNNASRIFHIENGSSTAPVAVNINNLTVTGGSSASPGGAISSTGENLILDRVIVSGSTASARGGGIYFSGVNDATLSLTNSTITGNTINTNHTSSGGLDVNFGYASIYLRNDTFTNNTSTGIGGAMNIELLGGSFTMLNSVVSNNTAGTDPTTNGGGGGVRISGDDLDNAVLISDSVITGNIADPNDVAAPSANLTFGAGGGLYVRGRTDNVIVRRTSIIGNTALRGGGFYSYAYSPATFENVTFASNQATHPTHQSAGGAAHVGYLSPVTFRETTIAGNSADVGGGLHSDGGTPALSNAIVANNTAGESPDIHRSSGTINASFTLIETPESLIIVGSGNITGIDPNLGALADNGSTILAGNPSLPQLHPQTLLPNAGSPAINTGDPTFTPPPSTDERGLPRVVGSRIDMGAAETDTVDLTVPTISEWGAMLLGAMLSLLAILKINRS